MASGESISIREENDYELVEVGDQCERSTISSENSDNDGAENGTEESFFWYLLFGFKWLLGFCFILIQMALIEIGFQLTTVGEAGRKMKGWPFFANPISRLCTGILLATICFSPLPANTILMAFLPAKVISFRHALTIAFGAELGTAALNVQKIGCHSFHERRFGRTLSAALLSDFFNVYVVLIIIPIEIASSLIETTATFPVDYLTTYGSIQLNPLGGLVSFVVSKIIKINEPAIDNANINVGNYSLNESFIFRCQFENGTTIEQCPYDLFNLLNYLFNYFNLPMTFLLDDQFIGFILLAACIPMMVLSILKLFNFIDKLTEIPKINMFLRKQLSSGNSVNRSFKRKAKNIMIGLGLSIVLQSNSFVLATLTSLVGKGLLDLEETYYFMIGANIGTTISGFVIAISLEQPKLSIALGLALSVLIYNVLGSMLFNWEATRQFPIRLSEKAGRVTGEYRWMLVIIFMCFLLVPAFLIFLSWFSNPLTYAAASLISLFIVLTTVYDYIETNHIEMIPVELRNWNFLPNWMSFETIDPFMSRWVTRLPWVGEHFRHGSAYHRRLEREMGLIDN